IDARMRFGTSKNAESGMRCGNFFNSIAAITARCATFGIGLCPARLRYVASSISNHSWRQSVCTGERAVAMEFSLPAIVLRNRGSDNGQIGLRDGVPKWPAKIG